MYDDFFVAIEVCGCSQSEAILYQLCVFLFADEGKNEKTFVFDSLSIDLSFSYYRDVCLFSRKC